MKHLSRVVWSEGMYLGPHHFQVQSRYFEDSIHFATNELWFESFGVVGCELDREGLANGILSLVHARGILPDGLTFNMPECDAPPEARQIADLFPVMRDKVTVLLGVPKFRPNGANCAPDDAAQPGNFRFAPEMKVLNDETTGLDEKPVRIGRKNIRLLLDTEPADGLETLPIARVTRDGSGHFIYDPIFIPPCLDVAASERVMNLLGRLIDILEEKSATLGAGKQAGARSWSEYSTRDIANFWMLHTVNAALAPLRHIYLTKRGHPEKLYMEMARLGGALCTFALDSHPRVIPAYNHMALDKTFEELDHHIRTHLETIVPTNCVPIPLQKTGPYMWEGDIKDDRVLNRSRWVFAIQAGTGEAETIQRTPILVKLCSSAYVPKLVERALPGMGLRHLSVPPSAISTRVDVQYFGVDKAGPCWDHILKTRRVGVYIPGELPDPKIELLVVLES